MDATLQMLYTIRKRPSLYFGANSLTLLTAFMDGYIFRLIEENPQYHCYWYRDFRNYVYDKFNVPYSVIFKHYETEYGCEHYIRQSVNTEKEALDLYYRFLDEFLEGRPDLR